MLSRRIDPEDPLFPAPLGALSPRPRALWVRGELPAAGPSVALVGTRRPSPEGARFAHELAVRLARAGVVVWSGGAFGIDHQAHRGALDAGGRTVLVAGGGLAHPYPASLRPLWDDVVASGALVSLVDDEHPALRWTFLARNGVLAALTDATVVVECPLQSGARSTAAVARRLGRPVWIGGQAPWSPFAPAVREELRLGARLLLHPDELLGTLVASAPGGQAEQGQAQARTRGRRAAAGRPEGRGELTLDPLEARVLAVVRGGARQLDEVCDRLEAPVGEVLHAVTSLQLQGLIRATDSGIE